MLQKPWLPLVLLLDLRWRYPARQLQLNGLLVLAP
jgi:hypothetical protein